MAKSIGAEAPPTRSGPRPPHALLVPSIHPRGEPRGGELPRDLRRLEVDARHHRARYAHSRLGVRQRVQARVEGGGLEVEAVALLEGTPDLRVAQLQLRPERAYRRLGRAHYLLATAALAHHQVA